MEIIFMKKYLIIAAIVLAIVVGVLAYLNYVPFWASIVSTLAFIAGGVIGWLAKDWSNKHVIKNGQD